MSITYDDIINPDPRLSNLLDLKTQLDLAIEMSENPDRMMMVQPILDIEDLQELHDIISDTIELISELKR